MFARLDASAPEGGVQRRLGRELALLRLIGDVKRRHRRRAETGARKPRAEGARRRTTRERERPRVPPPPNAARRRNRRPVRDANAPRAQPRDEGSDDTSDLRARDSRGATRELPNEEALGILSRFLRARRPSRVRRRAFSRVSLMPTWKMDLSTSASSTIPGVFAPPPPLTPTPRRDRAASRPRRRTLARTRADPRSLSRLDPTAALSSRPGAHARRKSNNDAARLAILLLPST